MLDVKPTRDRYVGRITGHETAMWDVKPDVETAEMDGEPRAEGIEDEPGRRFIKTTYFLHMASSEASDDATHQRLHIKDFQWCHP